MATDYKRMRVKRFAPLEERETPEGRYWRKFKYPVIQRLTSPATHIDFSPVSPHEYAVTTSGRVAIFDPSTNAERRSFSKFKDTALSGVWRSDGRLIAAGGVRPLVTVFDAMSRNIVRTFKGHTAPVHATRFVVDKTHIVSTGDDKSMRIWDMTSGAAMCVVPDAAADYIRTASVCKGAPYMVSLGSYDHTVSLWDVRSLRGAESLAAGHMGDSTDELDDASSDAGSDATSEASTADEGDDAAGTLAGTRRGRGSSEDDASSDRGSVDDDEDDEEDDVAGSSQSADDDAENTADVAVRSSRASTSAVGVAASTRAGAVMTMDHGEPVTQVLMLPGGSTMLSAGGTTVKLWDVVSGGRLLHTFSNHQKLITSMCLDGTESRLLTGALDGLVKVYEMSTFNVTHSMRYDGAILSMAVAPDNSRLVVGTTDGNLSVRQRIVKVAELLAERKSTRLLRGGTYRYFLRGQATPAAAGDVKVEGGKRVKLKAYDALLKTFQYRKALDAALATNDPVVIISMLEELVIRQGLQIAVSGRDEEALEPVLAFVAKYIIDPRFAPLLIDVAGVLLDTYAPVIGQSAAIDALMQRLATRVSTEVKLGAELLGMQGMLDLLMAASTNATVSGHIAEDGAV